MRSAGLLEGHFGGIGINKKNKKGSIKNKKRINKTIKKDQ